MNQPTERSSGLERIADGGTLLYAWLALIGVGLLVGLYGAFRVLTEGTVVLGIGNQLPWGILISTYEFFLLMSAGIVVGIVALSVVLGVQRFDPLAKRATLLALATLAAGLFTIVIGLGRPERPMVHALINANPSAPIWWVMMFAGAYGAALVGLLAVLELDRFRSDRLVPIVGTLALLLGIGVTVAAGMIFGTAQARPYYGGALAPVYFLVTGLLSGVAAVGLAITVEFKATDTTMPEEFRALMTDYVGPAFGVLLASVLLVAGIKAIYGLSSTSESTAMAYEHMLLGSFAPVYWGLGILVGLVVPLALMVYPGTRTTDGVMAASAMALVGVFVTRYEFVVGGQVVALTPDPGHQYPFVSYIPTFTEVSLIVFGFALCALVYTVGSLLLDVDELPEPSTGTMDPTTTGGVDDD